MKGLQEIYNEGLNFHYSPYLSPRPQPNPHTPKTPSSPKFQTQTFTQRPNDSPTDSQNFSFGETNQNSPFSPLSTINKKSKKPQKPKPKFSHKLTQTNHYPITPTHPQLQNSTVKLTKIFSTDSPQNSKKKSVPYKHYEYHSPMIDSGLLKGCPINIESMIRDLSENRQVKLLESFRKAAREKNGSGGGFVGTGVGAGGFRERIMEGGIQQGYSVSKGKFNGRGVGVCSMERSGMKVLREEKSEILKAMVSDLERIREKIYRYSSLSVLNAIKFCPAEGGPGGN
jgi:hypothetical protein